MIILGTQQVPIHQNFAWVTHDHWNRSRCIIEIKWMYLLWIDLCPDESELSYFTKCFYLFPNVNLFLVCAYIIVRELWKSLCCQVSCGCSFMRQPYYLLLYLRTFDLLFVTIHINTIHQHVSSTACSETINCFETWHQNLLYILSLDNKFNPIHLLEQKKPAQSPTHGLTCDGDTVPEGSRLTTAQKNWNLELMPGQIANFCPGIAWNTFLKDTTSLDDVWQKIRLHGGFQRTGAHFLALANIRLEPNERQETLYQRLNAFFQDNLLTPQNGISHYGTTATIGEDMTPSLKKTVVYMWLHVTHPGLPALAKQKYGAELLNKTLLR